MAKETKKVEAVEASETPAPKKRTRKTTKKVEEVKQEEIVLVGRAPILKDFTVVKHIIATEETQILRDKENAIVFAVDKKATKLEIKDAVQAIFNAKVKSVNTINVQAKKRRVGRYTGYLPQYKKAIVRFDSSFDLGKIAAATAAEDRQANED